MAKSDEVFISYLTGLYATGEDYTRLDDSISFSYNMDMKMKGRAALAANYDYKDVYFSVSSLDSVTGNSGPILIGKIYDITANSPYYEFWECYDSPELYVGIYGLYLSSDDWFLVSVGHF
jgi:hypothetical protein